jgi:hypothetical protein
MWREPPTHAGAAVRGRCVRAAAADHGRPRVGPLTTPNSGLTRGAPRLKLVPGRSSIPALATAAALAAAHEQRSATAVQIRVAERDVKAG